MIKWKRKSPMCQMKWTNNNNLWWCSNPTTRLQHLILTIPLSLMSLSTTTTVSRPPAVHPVVLLVVIGILEHSVSLDLLLLVLVDFHLCSLINNHTTCISSISIILLPVLMKKWHVNIIHPLIYHHTAVLSWALVALWCPTLIQTLSTHNLRFLLRPLEVYRLLQHHNNPIQCQRMIMMMTMMSTGPPNLAPHLLLLLLPRQNQKPR